jgi:hypothetical protein
MRRTTVTLLLIGGFAVIATPTAAEVQQVQFDSPAAFEGSFEIKSGFALLVFEQGANGSFAFPDGLLAEYRILQTFPTPANRCRIASNGAFVFERNRCASNDAVKRNLNFHRRRHLAGANGEGRWISG